MSEQSGKKWYVVRAISGKEKRVKEYLESEINRLKLHDLFHKFLFPLKRSFKYGKEKKLAKSEIIFPVMY